MSHATPQTRELAARESHGNPGALAPAPGRERSHFSVEDVRVGERLQLAVAPDHALDAFYHPFAYEA